MCNLLHFMANRGLTSEKAREMQKIGGGRPKGVLNPSTIAKIKTKQVMEEEIRKRAGLIINDLFESSRIHKVAASEALLDRGFGKVPQGINVQAVQFSLKELSEYRKNLQQGDPQGLPELPKPEETK